MWCERWTHKEGWMLKNWCFRELMLSFNWCWRRLLRVPWTARRSNQSVLKEINPNYSLEGLMLKLKLQYFGHLMWRTDSFEKTLMLGKIEGRSRRRRQRMRWLNGPGMLQSMGSQRVRQDWATEQVGDFIALIAQMPEVSLCPCWLMQRWRNCNHRQHLKDFWQQKCIIFWHCSNMWVFFLQTKQFYNTSWVSYNSTQFWYHLLRDNVRSHRLWAQSHKDVPHSYSVLPRMSVAHPGCYLRFWPTDYRSEVPTTPSSDSINLLGWLTKIRETFYLLDYQFIIKEYNSGISR